ncbi:unnamed protein product [Strongylus vulgaris]|uniref:Uncharacterized protein n=1 Tax=Strongylus vulgaris TaxID=40348 RepID=A0A3P7JG67_STRVU|nr:unnamed protein product [Strongylus vulgaris]
MWPPIQVEPTGKQKKSLERYITAQCYSIESRTAVRKPRTEVLAKRNWTVKTAHRYVEDSRRAKMDVAIRGRLEIMAKKSNREENKHLGAHQRCLGMALKLIGGRSEHELQRQYQCLAEQLGELAETFKFQE